MREMNKNQTTTTSRACWKGRKGYDKRGNRRRRRRRRGSSHRECWIECVAQDACARLRVCVCVCESISKDRQQTSSAYVKGARSKRLPACLTASLPLPAWAAWILNASAKEQLKQKLKPLPLCAIGKRNAPLHAGYARPEPIDTQSARPQPHLLLLLLTSSFWWRTWSRAKQSPWPTLTNCRPSLVAFNFHETRRQQLLS